MIVSIIAFLVMFSVIVVGHEFGHYAIARRNGIRVREFDVGMGPTILHKQVGETDFCLKMLPVGGACIFDGMDVLLDGGDLEDLDEHAYPKANVMARIATVLGGPAMNFVIGFIFALLIVAFSGTDYPVVYQVQENSAAEEAGIEAGDIIRSINGERIHIYREIVLASMMNYGEELEIVYERDGEKHEVLLTPRYNEESGRYLIGLIGSGHYEKTGVFRTFQYGFYEAEYWVRATFKSLAQIFRGHFSPDDLSGPVGIVQTVDETYTDARPYGVGVVLLSFLNLATLLSINLGIMNLLPIPALDGGKLLILLVEAVRGKPLDPQKEGIVTAAGVIMLLMLMIFVMFNDISRFFR